MSGVWMFWSLFSAAPPVGLALWLAVRLSCPSRALCHLVSPRGRARQHPYITSHGHTIGIQRHWETTGPSGILARTLSTVSSSRDTLKWTKTVGIGSADSFCLKLTETLSLPAGSLTYPNHKLRVARVESAHVQSSRHTQHACTFTDI